MRSIGYAPMYFMLARGFLEEEGLAVSVRTAPSPTVASEWILNGQGDVAWGGPIRILLNHCRDPRCPLVCFGSIIARDPFVLIGHEPRTGFRFADLEGHSVAVAVDVPTAWLTFQDDLARAGIEPASLTKSSAPSMRENVDRFLAGDVDVVQVFEPYIQELTGPALGHVWHRFSDRGDICYTTFYTRREFAKSNAYTCRLILRALARAQDAFGRAKPKEIAEVIARYFPALPMATLADAIQGYQAAALWPASPRISLAAFLRLKALAVSGGFISRDILFGRVVDSRLNGKFDLD